MIGKEKGNATNVVLKKLTYHQHFNGVDTLKATTCRHAQGSCWSGWSAALSAANPLSWGRGKPLSTYLQVRKQVIIK